MKKILTFVTFILCILVGAVFTPTILDKDMLLGNHNITTPKVIYDYQQEIDNLKVQNKELNVNIENLESKLENYENGEEVDYKLLQKELFNENIIYDIILGNTDVEGPGVEVLMSDSDEEITIGDDISNYIIHNSNVLKIVNELKYAGAEVIAINGYQLSWDSNIDCAGPVIYIDDFIAGTPFKIEAIGNQQKMMATLEADDSYYVELSRFSKINISLREKDNIVLKKN
ncbi:DUF881 domain-containing protein [Alkalibaculum bacchi]|nr:DUF881 domain-containing protein [Alkalibaculum bacchi]